MITQPIVSDGAVKQQGQHSASQTKPQPHQSQQQTYQQQPHSQQQVLPSQEQIPEHFYDSDMASVCEKDFQSDNEPPKDIVQERKFLYKEKLLHVYKTIIRVGTGIDKPARYDKIKMQHKQVPKTDIVVVKRKDIDKKMESEGQQEGKGQLQASQEKKQKSENRQQKDEIHNNEQNHKRAEQKQAYEKSPDQVSKENQNNDNNEQKQALETQVKAANQQQTSPDKPAHQPHQSQTPYSHPQSQASLLSGQSLPVYYSTQYLTPCHVQQFNLGNSPCHQDIQRLITSMKRGETALFQLQFLQVSKKSSIKIKAKTQIHLIHVYDWVTVIDLDGDRKFLKYVLNRGEGAFRVAHFDKISFQYELKKGNQIIRSEKYVNQQLEREFVHEKLLKIIWRVLNSMKDKERVELHIKDQDLKDYETEQEYAKLQHAYQQQKKTSITDQQPQKQPHQYDSQSSTWQLQINISSLTKIDDIYLDGRLLKQTLMKGVSTAKPEGSSLVFYALKFINDQQQVLKTDQCFQSDWWEDFGVLDQIKGIRKNYLDDYKISKMLKKTIKRMKPAEVAMVECRDMDMFQYGSDFQQLKQLLNLSKEQKPFRVKLIIRIYNFTQPKTAFNMQLQQKIIQSRRIKQTALLLLSEGKIQKSLKRFQSIIAFYSSQKIDQQAYDEKVSALMNAILCYMKMKKYPEMISLCNSILERPRHGHQFKDIKIVGPGHAKVEGNLNKEEGEVEGIEEGHNKGDTRRIAGELVQNKKIIDKCLYRKAFALCQIGECEEALKGLNRISQNMNATEQVVKLHAQATKGKQKYEQKSKKIFKSMFG